MKRITLLSVLLACGFLAASTSVFAQSAAAVTPSNWFTGKATLLLLGRDNVDSSKFEEYRVVPKGVSMPVFTLQGSQDGKDFALFGQNIYQQDQRYFGYANVSWFGVSFDYNQIPHNMGNNGHSIEAETALGVWSMSSTLRQTLGTAVDTQLPTSTRTYPFYQALFAPTIAAANLVDISGLRQRGNMEFDLGQKLPFDLKMTYMREVKSGSRGIGGGVVYSNVNSIVELPESLDELTQDLEFRAAVNKAWGNVYAAFAYNWYNNRQETTVFDNPLRPSDLAYTAASGSIPALGGPGSGRLINPPDNEANTTSFGAMLKFAKQTRVTADVVMGRWSQNAQVYPYTINSSILTTAGARADSVTSLDKQSLDGKINSTTLNFGFSSRPVEGLGVRIRYRSYDLANKTPLFVRTGSVGNSPDRSWTALTATNYAEFPLGWATANPYGYKTGRLDLQGSYDFNALTIEGTYHHVAIERTYREATKGADSGASIAAVIHASDWMLFRGVFDKSNRTASGYDAATSTGLQSDESERDSTRTGFNLELTPNAKVAFVMAYFRRNDDYPNRPNRVAGVADTQNGLIKAKYDTFTGEIDYTPNEKAEVSFYYTYEKNLSTTRYGSTLVTNILTFDGSDTTDTFGINANVVLVPEKWAFKFNARRQKLDALMGITGDPAGSFALARAAYGGIQDITDYDDTEWTTVSAQLDYTVAKSWGLAFGYAYEKYSFADAYSSGNEVFPATGGFYLKADDGPYTANILYSKLTYRF